MILEDNNNNTTSNAESVSDYVSGVNYLHIPEYITKPWFGQVYGWVYCKWDQSWCYCFLY